MKESVPFSRRDRRPVGLALILGALCLGPCLSAKTVRVYVPATARAGVKLHPSGDDPTALLIAYDGGAWSPYPDDRQNGGRGWTTSVICSGEHWSTESEPGRFVPFEWPAFGDLYTQWRSPEEAESFMRGVSEGHTTGGWLRDGVLTLKVPAALALPPYENRRGGVYVKVEAAMTNFALAGRLLNAQTGLPLPYATVYFYARPHTGFVGRTQPDGRFVFRANDGTRTRKELVFANAYNSISVESPGFRPIYDRRIQFPDEALQAVLPDVLLEPEDSTDPKDRPVVLGIQPKYDGLFLAGISLLNEYTATVSWGGRTPGSVEFYVNGALTHTVPTSSDQATVQVDMALGFFGSLRVGANTVRAVAVDASGERSEAFTQAVTVIPTPATLDLLSLPFEFIPGNDPAYRFKVQVPPASFPASAVIPIRWFDKIGLSLAGVAELKYRVLGGEWDFRTGLKVGSPQTGHRC
jgi:hypothetical protein